MHPADEEERIARMNDEAADLLDEGIREHGDAIVYDDREWDPHSIEAMNAEAWSDHHRNLGL